MDRKVFTIMVLYIGVAIGIVVSFTSFHKSTTGVSAIHMLDIGQGDSFLIVAPNGAKMLIDGGKDAQVLTKLSEVLPLGDSSIDVVLATHPDADHIGGLPYVLDRYHVGLFLTSDVFSDTKTVASMYSILDKKKIPSYYVRHGMYVDFGTDTISPQNHFDVLFPDRDTSHWETNSASVVGKLYLGNRTALFTGDSPIAIEAYLLQTIPEILPSDILKLGHHGSKTSNSFNYLKTIHPSLALISAGVDNSYGHPHQETLTTLSTLHIPYVSTQTAGTVTLTVSSDGTTWNTKKEK
ncbi:MAG: MBL fold metallo-hydrolase [bacterium]